MADARKKSESKSRLDKLLLDRGLAASRERAQALILAGKVLVNDQKLEKAGAQVDADCVIRLLGEDLRYVGRGGLKLERALEHWKIDVAGKVCLDVGASTGGFTDCLVQHGAARVIAVDTGYGQMDFKLRQDERVHLLEKTNARYLTREALGESVDFVAMDVAFISATLVLPAVVEAAFAIRTEERLAARSWCWSSRSLKPEENMWARAALFAMKTPRKWPSRKSKWQCSIWVLKAQIPSNPPSLGPKATANSCFTRFSDPPCSAGSGSV